MCHDPRRNISRVLHDLDFWCLARFEILIFGVWIQVFPEKSAGGFLSEYIVV